jgi:membrane associated rhomboid family serine protease
MRTLFPYTTLFRSPALVVTVGASGAIFGIFGALIAYAFLNRHRDYMARAMFGQLMFWLVLNVVLGLTEPGLSWQGHVGGFVTGIVLMCLYTMFGRKNPAGRFSGTDVAVTVAVVVVLVALTFWRVQTFTLAAFIPWL